MDLYEIPIKFLFKFWEYFSGILPFFLLATIFGAFIQSYISFNVVRKFVNKRYLSPIITATFGASAPVCSCSMIPIAQTINSLSKGYAPAFYILHFHLVFWFNCWRYILRFNLLTYR